MPKNDPNKVKVQFDLENTDIARLDALIPGFFHTRAEFLRRAIRFIHFLLTEVDLRKGMVVTLKDGSTKTILLGLGL